MKQNWSSKLTLSLLQLIVCWPPTTEVIIRIVLTQCRRLGRFLHIKIKVRISVFSSTFYVTKLIDHKRFIRVYFIERHNYKWKLRSRTCHIKISQLDVSIKFQSNGSYKWFIKIFIFDIFYRGYRKLLFI